MRPRRGMPTRVLLGGGVATALLATGSTLGVAAASGAFTASRCTTPSLDGTIVQVTTIDMGSTSMNMMSNNVTTMRLAAAPAAIRSGSVSLLVRNVGSRTHELIVLPLDGGRAAGARPIKADGRIDETGSVGEASRNCGAGSGQGIKPGAAGWVTLHLTPGRYELVCNEKDHYRHGMFAELQVT
jgi:uncharacterized cupredoxin-like copper-binding protein